MAHIEHHEVHHHDHAPEQRDGYFLSAETWGRVRNSLAFVALAGWIALIAGFFADRAQFHFSYLVAFLFFASIGLGAMFYVMVQHLTGSAWSVTVRRIMETIMSTVPLSLLAFVPVALGIHYTYHWSHIPDAQKDPILSQKLVYLNDQWFLIRAAIVLVVWSLFAIMLYRNSRNQDASGDLAFTRRLGIWSAPGVLVLFLSGSLAAFDWNMSLEPHWFSTMYGVIMLAGGALGFMALLIVICLSLRSAGYLKYAVNNEHYHDLGKWLFALTVFWAYVSFSQYMLIWYGNLPEETFWYKHRMHGTWLWVSLTLIVGHFIVPFFSLLPRASKRNHKVLGFFAVWMLLMHYVHLYWEVMPVHHKEGVSLHWLDFAAMVALAGSYGLVFWHGFKEKPLVPVGDPRLEQCLAFHNA